MQVCASVCSYPEDYDDVRLRDRDKEQGGGREKERGVEVGHALWDYSSRGG